MKSLFEKMDGTYRQVGDYFIPNFVLPDISNYQIGKYGVCVAAIWKNAGKSFIPIM